MLPFTFPGDILLFTYQESLICSHWSSYLLLSENQVVIAWTGSLSEDPRCYKDWSNTSLGISILKEMKLRIWRHLTVLKIMRYPVVCLAPGNTYLPSKKVRVRTQDSFYVISKGLSSFQQKFSPILSGRVIVVSFVNINGEYLSSVPPLWSV